MFGSRNRINTLTSTIARMRATIKDQEAEIQELARLVESQENKPRVYTTAEILNGYRSELRANGFWNEQIDNLVRDAARELVRETAGGLVVGKKYAPQDD